MSSAKRIVLATHGTLGDLHPYLAIALELKARGHKPVIASCKIHQQKVEAAGVEFRGIRPDLPTTMPHALNDSGLGAASREGDTRQRT